MADTEDQNTQRAEPQKIEPQKTDGATAVASTQRQGHARWYAAIALALVVVAAVAALAYYLVGRDDENTPEAQIEKSVGTFVDALAAGDIATLREHTCGPLAEYYRTIPDEQFADVHSASTQEGSVPVIDGVDAVQVTGDKAIAQVIAYTKADPGNRTARTLNLENSDQGWKVCDPPA